MSCSNCKDSSTRITHAKPLPRAYANYDDKSSLVRQETFETLKLLPATSNRRYAQGYGNTRAKYTAHHQQQQQHRRYQSIADYIALALNGMPETQALETLNSVTRIVIDAQLSVAKRRHSEAASADCKSSSCGSSAAAEGIAISAKSEDAGSIPASAANLIVLSELSSIPAATPATDGVDNSLDNAVRE